MPNYQVVKIEKNYIGTYEFDNFGTALIMFNTFVEEAKREEELDITQAVFITKYGVIKERWEK